MGRRVLAFFLGMLFGIIFVIGGTALSVYIVLCKVEVGKMIPSADTYMGDLANKSAYDIVMDVYRLYGEKVGIADEQGNYYTIRQFCENYNIDLETAFGGVKLPNEVLEMPAFEFFAEGGTDRALNQIKVSTIPAIFNIFGGGEDGVLSQDVMDELSKFSIRDLFSEEVGFKGVTENVKLSQVMPSAFPAEDSDNKLMWAMGQTYIGKALNGVSGSENIMLQLKAGGAFETLGGLALTELTGESNNLITGLGKNTTFADLIDDNGNFYLDDMLDGLMLGDVLNCQRENIENTDGFENMFGDGQADTRVMGKETDGKTAYIKTADGGETWYKAEFDCGNEQTEHFHDENCYGFVWYYSNACDKEHDHASCGDLYKEEAYYARVDGLYSALVNFSIADLTSGDDSALTDEIKTLTLRDILGSDVPKMLKDIADVPISDLQKALDDMYLGGLLQYWREKVQVDSGNTITVLVKKSNIAGYLTELDDGTYAMSDDSKLWYRAELICDKEQCLHAERDCYSYYWYKEESLETAVEGMMRKLAEIKVGAIGELNETIKTFTLHDVLGDDVPGMLKEVQHITIGNLDEAVNTLYLGSAMNYVRRPVDIIHYPTLVQIQSVNGEILRAGGTSGDYKTAIYAKSTDGEIWYEAVFECFEKDHLNQNDHTTECFPFVWYSRCNENCAADHEHGNYFDDGKLYAQVKGVTKAFVNCKLNTVGGKMQNLTLRQLGIESNGNNILQAIEDIKIMEIGKEINQLHMGVVLGYVRECICEQDHIHIDECPHRWLEKCERHDGNSLHDESEHVVIDGETYGPVKGLNSKVADKTVKNIGSGSGITDIAKSLTIGDLIDSGMMSIGGTNNEYKFAIIYYGKNKTDGNANCDYRDNCNLADFVAKRVLNPALTATEYWTNAHKDMSEGEMQIHRYEWKNLTLDDFISMLLSAI